MNKTLRIVIDNGDSYDEVCNSEDELYSYLQDLKVNGYEYHTPTSMIILPTHRIKYFEII